jgi:4-hydroxybenzoate polyprenyltransferase
MFFAIKPFFDLCRISNLPTVWTNVLAAVVLSSAVFSWFNFLILAFSMSLFYSGGMCLNDICDVDIDHTKKPFRAIPSGKISIRNAYILTIAMFVIALSLLFTVPYKAAIFAGFFLVAVIVAYDIFHKSHPLSVLLMATCRLMIFIVSSLAVSGTVCLFVAIAGLLQFGYTLAVSLTARHENRKKIPYNFPVIPAMISCISLLDGIVLAILASTSWLVVGICGAVLTLAGQKYIRGD